MPWTAAPRKEKRALDKAEAENKRKLMGNELKRLAPPTNKLNRPYKKKDVGVNTVDYGGHQKALNFPFPEDFSQGEIQLALATGGEVPQAESMHSKKRPKSVKDAIVNLVERVGTLTIGLVCDKCRACQLFKKRQLKKLGQVPPKDPEVKAWHTLCIGLIGPYTIGQKENATTSYPSCHHCYARSRNRMVQD